jgi:DNA-binding transcriptional regulator YiaG
MSNNKLSWDGYHIRALRKHLRLTQAKMADELGTRQQTISEWEIGMYKPRGTSVTLLNIIAERSAFSYNSNPEKHQ